MSSSAGSSQSFCEMNNLSFQSHEELEALFHHELAQWDRGPIKLREGK